MPLTVIQAFRKPLQTLDALIEATAQIPTVRSASDVAS